MMWPFRKPGAVLSATARKQSSAFQSATLALMQATGKDSPALRRALGRR